RGAVVRAGDRTRVRRAGADELVDVRLGRCLALDCVVEAGLQEVSVSSSPETRPGRRSGRRGRVLVALGAIGLIAAGAAPRGSPPSSATARVERQDLPLAVDVDGELVAVRTTDIGPPVVRDMWEYKITFLAPEATQVKKGQPVVAFDASPLQRQLEEKQAEY